MTVLNSELNNGGDAHIISQKLTFLKSPAGQCRANELLELAQCNFEFGESQYKYMFRQGEYH
jgi:hypothetical protein